MHSEIIQFIKTLNEMNSNSKFQLEMVALRITSVKKYYEFATEGNKQKEYKEILQNLTDLYTHLYNNKPLKDFGKLKVIDCGR